VHISNALLLGLAHKIREKIKVPVVCSLQDEDVWIDPMHPEMADKAWQLMREKAADVDMFIPVSQYYTKFMKDKLNLPDSKLATLPLGVDPADYQYKNAAEKPQNIGYLSRLCYENGLDILVDAFILMKKMDENKDVRLLLTGGHTADDKAFIKEQKQKLTQAGVISSVEFIPHFENKDRSNFFERVQLLSVPVRNGEAFGIYLAEAMASGIPVVQPALGAFPEIVEQSGGGITFANNTPDELALALSSLLHNKERIAQLSEKARESVGNIFNVNELASQLTSVYERVIADFRP
jgi:glycosyltransferase involved in cell wall biosynthesis